MQSVGCLFGNVRAVFTAKVLADIEVMKVCREIGSLLTRPSHQKASSKCRSNGKVTLYYRKCFCYSRT